MRKFLYSALALAAVATPAQAMANASAWSSYAAVLGQYIAPDDDRAATDVDYGGGVGFLIGAMFERDGGLGFEINVDLDTFETGSTTATDFYRYGFGLDATYSFGNREALTPFVMVGLGGGFNDVLPDDDDGLTATGRIGVGLVTAPLFRDFPVKVRAQALYGYDDVGEGYWEPELGIGVEMPLWTAPPPPLPPAKPQVQVVEVPTGLLDDDDDGVINDKDRCPRTPPGTRVNGDGCELQEILELKGVTFELDATRLRPDAQSLLDWAVKLLRRYPDMQVEVAGHTDSLGSNDYNQALSEARAQTVVDYFVETGVRASQIQARGYGETQPIAPNDTPTGRERNRRVELRVLN